MSFSSKKALQSQVNTNNILNKNKEVIQKSYKSSSISSSSSSTITTTIKEVRHYSSSNESASSSLLQSSTNGFSKSSTFPTTRGYDPVYKPVASTSTHSMLKPFGHDASFDAIPFGSLKPVPTRTTAREAFFNTELPAPSKPNSVFTSSKPYNTNTPITKPSTTALSNEAIIKNILSSAPEKYTLNGKEQGYVVIFNHEHFKDKSMERRGTQNDEKELIRVFENFKFRVIVHRDLKLKNIKSEIASLRKRSFSKNNCLVIIILSHGDENETISAYDEHYSLQTTMVEEIIQNDTLLGKPKIFIINACKGNIEPKPIKVLQQDSVTYKPKSYEKSIPRETEILKIYSTFEKRVSYRDQDRGSIFIQTLCEKLLIKGYHTPIDDILREVRKEITEKLNQTPSETSSMTKKFCFGDALRKK